MRSSSYESLSRNLPSTQEVWHWCRCNPGDRQLEGFRGKQGQKNVVRTFISSLQHFFCVCVFEQHCLNHCCSCRGNCCDSPVYWEKNRYEFSHTHTRIKMATHHRGNKQQSNLIILSLQSSKTPAAPRFFYVVLLYMYDWFHSVHWDTRTGVDVWANARKMPVFAVTSTSFPYSLLPVRSYRLKLTSSYPGVKKQNEHSMDVEREWDFRWQTTALKP